MASRFTLKVMCVLSAGHPYLPTAYASWQERLAREFFTGHSGHPVVMFVDHDELNRMTDPGEDGPRALASAVSLLVDVARGPSMFARVKRAEEAWERGTLTTPPPTLPLLALSVLAASEMRNDASGASHNYYIRLAAALLPDANEVALEDLRRQLRERGAFLEVVAMWRQLDAWLYLHDGDYGTSTIPDDPGHRNRIAYPLSQTLVRRSDHPALTRFFDKMQLTRSGIPGPEALLRLLSLWTGRRPQGFSDQFRQAIDQPELKVLLMPLIHKLACNWDGRVVTVEGLRRLDLRLTIDIDRAESWWVIPLVTNPPTDSLTGISDGRLFSATIKPDPHSAVYLTDGLPAVTAGQLQHGLSGRGTSCIAEFRPTDLMVFVDSADAGGWMSTDALQAYEEHILAARPQIASAVETALELAADDGWRRLSDFYGQQTLGGYVIYYGITFSDPERLSKAVELLPWRLKVNIQLGATLRPRLVNGLPLFRNLGRGMYLAGGEPDLELPLGAEERYVPVRLDGSPPHNFLASIFPIPFSVILQHELGSHTIEADGEELNFEVVNGVGSEWTPANVGSLGWTDGHLGPTTKGVVCGAVTPTDQTSPPVLVRRGAEANWIVGSSGHLEAFDEPSLPIFLPGASFAFFEMACNRGCWVIQRRNRTWQLTRLEAQPPAFGNLSPTEEQLWAEAVENVCSEDEMWLLYAAQWKQSRGH